MKVENAKTLPKVYYGLHMVEGVAEYKDEATNNGQPYRIFVGESVIKNMDPTYAGKPLYVLHVDDVNLDALQNEADGYVVESFFNKSDGKHWAKFIVVSDRGHEAIRSGWKLSNAYIPKQFSGGGKWHGVDYLKEVEAAEYEHLALVPNPRYEESIILTPEEFKTYNSDKELELKKLANSLTKGAKAMFSFFKKTKVDNAADLEAMSVVLPKTGKEVSLSSIINAADEAEEKKEKKEEQMADGEHHVLVGEGKMKVNELVKKYMDMCHAAKNEGGEEKGEEKEENSDVYYHPAPKKPKDKESNADIEPKEAPEAQEKPEEKKVMDMDGKAPEEGDHKEALAKSLEIAEHEVESLKDGDEKKKEKKQNSAHFDALKNAESNVARGVAKLELSEDRVARGKARYGS
jgi:hypothetical protein